MFTVSKVHHPAFKRQPEKQTLDPKTDCNPDFTTVGLDPDDYLPICTPNMESSVNNHDYKTTYYMGRQTTQYTDGKIRAKRDVE